MKKSLLSVAAVLSAAFLLVACGGATPSGSGVAAYKTANFGMSKEEVQALPEFSDWEVLPDELSAVQRIEAYDYDVFLAFENDKLNAVQILTPVWSADEYDTEIMPAAENLVKYFTAAYGQPSEDQGVPYLMDFSPGVKYTVCTWNTEQVWASVVVMQRDRDDYGFVVACHVLPQE